VLYIVEAAHRSKQITYHYVTLDVMQHAKMHGLIAICILTSVHLEGTGASAGTTEANSVHHADATFREPNLAAPDLVLAQVAGQSQESLRIDEDELLAAIVSAHISEPDRVAGVLKELRLESTGHIGRLDPEEWSEMMAEMRSDGVALGSRNKLRLLVAGRSASACTWPAWADGPRRVQELQAEESSSRTGRQGDSTSAAKQASGQESTNKTTDTIFGVSGDSAPRVSPCD
jgi:hypothetical protein